MARASSIKTVSHGRLFRAHPARRDLHEIHRIKFEMEGIDGC